MTAFSRLSFEGARYTGAAGREGSLEREREREGEPPRIRATQASVHPRIGTPALRVDGLAEFHDDLREAMSRAHSVARLSASSSLACPQIDGERFESEACSAEQRVDPSHPTDGTSQAVVLKSASRTSRSPNRILTWVRPFLDQDYRIWQDESSFSMAGPLPRCSINQVASVAFGQCAQEGM